MAEPKDAEAQPKEELERKGAGVRGRDADASNLLKIDLLQAINDGGAQLGGDGLAPVLLGAAPLCSAGRQQQCEETALRNAIVLVGIKGSRTPCWACSGPTASPPQKPPIHFPHSHLLEPPCSGGVYTEGVMNEEVAAPYDWVAFIVWEATIWLGPGASGMPSCAGHRYEDAETLQVLARFLWV